MSDSEYSIPLPRISANDAADEGLNDHRHQRERLPPPEDPLQLSPHQNHPHQNHPHHQNHQNLAPEVHHPRRNSRAHSSTEDAEEARKNLRKSTKSARIQMQDTLRLQKMKTNDSAFSMEANAGAHYNSRRERRLSRSSVDLEADSHASRSSQETEEDVCFPMEHVRINGIDFSEIEAFIEEERLDKSLLKKELSRVTYPAQVMFNNRRQSVFSGSDIDSRHKKRSFIQRTSNAIRNIRGRRRKEYDLEMQVHDVKPSDSSDEAYLYEKTLDDRSSDNVKFGGTRINNGELELPERFSFFHSDNEETVHSPDLAGLVEEGKSVSELFHNGESTWWLDCTCPTDAEMKVLAKAFGIHPLTAEDIRMQETREKVELFRNYYFVCFHTFEPDKESEDYLEPINVYIVVFREGVLTFHFSPISHPANVRRRVRQLREYVDVSADWIGYAMIDDITDGFAPVITAIEYEADAIEASVLDAQLINFSSMLRNIGESRRKVMTLMRLLSNKADVIRMFAKRCQDEASQFSYSTASRLNLNNMAQSHNSQSCGISFGPPPGAPPGMMAQVQTQGTAHPRADIALYLGDIQDHVVTMFQNLAAYEKIFSRSHSNYLAQLQVESFNANLVMTNILGNVTLLGTLFLPLNVITGAFGMNVKVPGEGADYWFYGIVGFMALLVVVMYTIVKMWLKRTEAEHDLMESGKKSIKSFSLKNKLREIAKSILSVPNRYD
ncbi:hypothetical protein PUMCH_004022 [Australozyma saopauloensis]|uniref:Magnesium transporter ALR2 n=1 Tax=Australozyma saopauloensis TaxID=291208 RepID=A0AAX4HDG7_9ASCO|nr:hypothetical protein PUMCH_004022 [[Candida] saopauloensis]